MHTPFRYWRPGYHWAILKGEYPVDRGFIIGREPVGTIEILGSDVQGYKEGQRVIAGGICPSGQGDLDAGQSNTIGRDRDVKDDSLASRWL